MPRNTYDKLLAKWAAGWKTEHLTPEVVKLITQANTDLFTGPIKDGAYGDPAEGDQEYDSYPGFTKAVGIIRDALREMPSDVYFDTETDQWQETEPSEDTCDSCEGQGTYTDESGESFKCDTCGGVGRFEVVGDWYHAERAELRIALVGSELSEYVK